MFAARAMLSLAQYSGCACVRRVRRNDAPVSSRPPLPRNVWVLGFVSLLMDLSSEIYHALLPAFITIVLGPAGDGARRDRRDRRSDRQFRQARCPAAFPTAACKRKPWIIAGYGLAALVQAAVPARGERAGGDGRALRRPHRQGHSRQPRATRWSPTRRRPRSAAAPSACRQALDTVGALLAPLAAIGADGAGSRATSARCSGSR